MDLIMDQNTRDSLIERIISVFLIKYEEIYKLVKINLSSVIKNPENEKEEIEKHLKDKIDKVSKDKCFIFNGKEMADYLKNKYIQKKTE